MPSFEVVLIIKEMQSNTALKTTLKRCAEYVFEVGGTLRKMENLGLRSMPYKISGESKAHRTGHFFIFNIDCGLDQPAILKEKFKLDLDVVRATTWQRYVDPIDRHAEKEKPECTMHLDLLPAAYRPNVLALQKQWEIKQNKKKPPPHLNYKDTDFLIF